MGEPIKTRMLIPGPCLTPGLDGQSPPLFARSQNFLFGTDMSSPTIQVNNHQLVEALSQFPPDGLKKVIDQLFRRKLYSPPPLADITRAVSRAVKREKLWPETAAEAAQWARSQK